MMAPKSLIQSQNIAYMALSFSTQSHCCRRQSMLTVSEYLLAHLMSVNGFQRDISQNLFRRKSETDWPSHNEVSQVISSLFQFLMIYYKFFCCCHRPLPITRFVRENRQHAVISHKPILSALRKISSSSSGLNTSRFSRQYQLCCSPTAACPSSLQVVLMYTAAWEQVLFLKIKAKSRLSFSASYILSKTNLSPPTDLHPLL